MFLKLVIKDKVDDRADDHERHSASATTDALHGKKKCFYALMGWHDYVALSPI